MRPDPGNPHSLPEVGGQPAAGMIRQVRRYELITPLFGGGVEPQQADPVTVVRGSEIRGQLRFWWRACRGGQFGGDLQRMKEAEEALWGAASGKDKPQPSKVQVVVADINEGGLDKPFHVISNPKTGRPQLRPREGSIVPSYAAFPLQPEQRSLQVGMELPGVRVGVKFTLTITYPDDKDTVKEVEAALWAWETFGGLGARTRRGFGALRRLSGPGGPLPPADNARRSLEERLAGYISGASWPKDVPHLGNSPHMRFVPADDPVDAWSYLIGRLRSFRQWRGNNGLGRSKWPEPDAIRRLTSHASNHAPVHPVTDKFPRAVFGLPIVFKFKQADENNGDPGQTSLEGIENGRMASPLILKPLACANGAAVALALVLQGPSTPPGGVRLKNAPGNPIVAISLDQTRRPLEADNITPLNGEPNVLLAFLNFL